MYERVLIDRSHNESERALQTNRDSGSPRTDVMQALNALRTEEPAFERAINVQQFVTGNVIATAEDLAEKMFVLMNGKVNLVCTNNEGRRLVIGSLEPGAIFGEGALEHQSDPNIFVEAASDAAIWIIPAADARNTLFWGGVFFRRMGNDYYRWKIASKMSPIKNCPSGLPLYC